MKTISNNEKAWQIASLITSTHGIDVKQEPHTYSAAMQAMRWKDEQFLQSLEELPQKNHAIYDLIGNLKKAMEKKL